MKDPESARSTRPRRATPSPNNSPDRARAIRQKRISRRVCGSIAATPRLNFRRSGLLPYRLHNHYRLRLESHLCFVFPERRGPAPLVHLERAVLEFAGPFVTVDDNARGRRLGVHKTEGPGYGPVAEEPLAGANHDRKDQQTKLVDEVVFQQRLD